uniref:Nicotinate-nucleotide pyrophosphorylase [carboxylating] n=1 Tax=Aplanochytrium stocchinoi TaxID=215587 RepID=A0A7S3PJ33_9STRA|mmetsp:Transcript_18334/g.22466  ORF Transcript_18334/g.22466 Transcript_18334/m.22466 type:complete len:302 (+) Transcript_18334:192-1097(+)|eukprot:CAMPEP_0204826234 /NCGR_PEP_ID=MMETSP1346-20131115/3961_1 /ASSEMBLY_ACC=CAM_ASM_000771 /TAXON_ID=215587 /ORGANISM="Aplanochytrium stocchinoi, Strain GSBS06" /LENGTH=301 /DNA_ID=CAMNT_0051954161 /DNA_START=111 /DNA_END=1016 /DNA_ORIENTATION=-
MSEYDDAEFFSSLANVLPPIGDIRSTIELWLKTDVPSFDVGGYVVGDKTEVALLLGKSPGVVCGIEFAKIVFEIMNLSVEWYKKDGDIITAEEAKAKKPVAKVTGEVRRILLAERTALNIMARASGVATEARKMRSIKESVNWHGQVAGTRKTTPGFSFIEKYSLLVGGVSTHRLDLSQMTMLKDNHVWSVGSITKAVKKARFAAGFSSKIEVECRDLTEAIEACTAGAEVVMLDNYTPEGMKVDAKKLKAQFPHVTVEASGGITEDTIAAYMSEDVDVISMGKLTQGYGSLDFSLKVQRN